LSVLVWPFFEALRSNNGSRALAFGQKRGGFFPVILCPTKIGVGTTEVDVLAKSHVALSRASLKLL
jgi:hypothetical protein